MPLEILGVRVDPLTHREVRGVIESFLQSSVPHYIVTINPEFIMAARNDVEFRTILNNADLAIADGIGVLWAASLLTEPVPLYLKTNQKARWRWTVRTGLAKAFAIALFPSWIRAAVPARVSGSDLVRELARETKARIAFIGGRRGVAHRAANMLLKHNLKSHIIMTDDGLELSIDAEHHLRYDEGEQQALLLRIQNAKPDVVFVAFGGQKQEKWIVDSFRHLPHVKLLIGVGGSFDFIAGELARAPRVLQYRGLEWVWRWVLQPWRAKRMMNATIRFMRRVMEEKYQQADRAL